MAKKSNFYFDSFVTMAQAACQAAELLHQILHGFDPEKLEGQRSKMHEIEHGADQVKHQMMEQLLREFLPPIEREDISAMAQSIDGVIDHIEEVLLRIYMYDIHTLREEAVQFSELIVRACRAMLLAMQEFPNYRKSSKIHEAVVQINSIEEEGDRLYISAGRRLYTDRAGSDPEALAAWMRVLDHLEDCCDACEHVADLTETVVMKNS